MLLRQAVRLPAAPYVRHIPRRMNCRIWAAGMIAKTFFPEQDIYRIGVQSLREKISLRDHWHVTCPSCPVRGLRRPCRFGPGHGRRPRRRPDGHTSLHRADRGPALTRRHCAMAHAAGGRGTAPRQSPLALGLGDSSGRIASMTGDWHDCTQGSRKGRDFDTIPLPGALPRAQNGPEIPAHSDNRLKSLG